MERVVRGRKRSAGVLLFRRVDPLEVFLVHPGGPFWAKKDMHAWSIPKGEYDEDETAQAAALRELEEETGFRVSSELVTHLLPLGELRQSGGKIVTAFATEISNVADFDPAHLRSNTFSLEWPPHSFKLVEFPEIDRAAWFTIDQARDKILESQQPLLDRLLESI